MNHQKIEGMTRDLGKPRNWDEATQGTCGSLPIRDERQQSGNVMVSEWKPTAEELRALIAGASVFLEICGTVHPPLSLYVGEP